MDVTNRVAGEVSDIERETMARVMRRLVPFLILCYFAAYLDRVNVGFAALTMNKALGLTATAFGLGAGIFFLAYFVFEVPSNLALDRFGASKWIARIMITWAIFSGLTAFIPWITHVTGLSNAGAFYLVRLLLGGAEAGFFPGIIFYLAIWFPAVYRARVVGYFMTAVPLSTVIGSPISGLVLGLDGVLGLQGWQWLFIIEAIPSLVLGVICYFYLTDLPEHAHWLPAAGRTWLVERLAAERQIREAAREFTVLEALGDTRVLLLAIVYFGVVAANYGLSFFLPQIIKAFGLSNVQTGFVNAIPFLVGLLGMIYWGRRSDRLTERKEHFALAALLIGFGVSATTLIDSSVGKMIAFSFAGFGIFAVLPVFWTLPTAFLSGTAAAAGIAIINSIGNLAGFAGPFVMGKIRDQTGSFTVGLLAITGLVALAALIALALPHEMALEKPPEDKSQLL